MANTNIPTSLSTSTQIPVDGKTYKNILSEITSVSAEQAFTYYSGMIVTIAENNKQYIWKTTDLTDDPVSNIYTYPSNHTVNDFDYSGKSFAFYEYKASSGAPIPEPDNRLIYKPDVVNTNYTPHPTLYNNEMFENIVDETSILEPDETNTSIYRARLYPLASKSLKIFHSPYNPLLNRKHIPIRIELYPDNAASVGEGGQYETIEDAIGNDEPSIIILPGYSGTVRTPISGDRRVHLSDGASLVAAVGASSIFSNNGNNQRLTIAEGASIDLRTPLVDATGLGSFTIEGRGTITANNLQRPLLRTTSNPQAVGATNVDTMFNINIEGTTIELLNTTLGSFDVGSNVNIKNNVIKSYNTTKHSIISQNSNINIENSEIVIENTNTSSFINAVDGVNIDFNNNTVSGDAPTFITLEDIENKTPEVTITNSNLRKLNNTVLVSTTSDTTGTDLKKININNIQVKDYSSIADSIEGISINNTIDQEGYQPKNETLTLRKFLDRDRAIVVLPEYTLFINTNNNNEDRDTWFLDIAISKASPF